MAVCAYEYKNPPQRQCPHRVWPQDGRLCVFHSRLDGRAADFCQELLKDRTLNHLHSHNVIDLRGFVFPPNFAFADVSCQSRLRFDDSEFLGSVYFRNFRCPQQIAFATMKTIPGLFFEDCQLEGGLEIQGTRSSIVSIGSLVLHNCKLASTFRLAHARVQEGFGIRFDIPDKKPGNSKASFGDVAFLGDVHFCRECFSAGLTWEDIRFGDNAVLIIEDNAFGTKVEISGVSFPSSSDLRAGVFSGSCEFDLVSFPFSIRCDHFGAVTTASFTHVSFLKGVFFYEAKLSASFDFQACTFHESCNFSKTRLRNQGRIRFWNGCRFTGDLSFYECDLAAKDALNFERCTFNEIDFRKTDLESVSFAHCAWSEKGGLFRHRHLFEDKNSYDECEVVYRDLKNKFEKEGDHDNANAFAGSELEMRRLRIGEQRGWRKWASPYYLFLCLYGMLSLYGNSFVRVLHWAFWTFLVWVAVSLFAPWRGATGTTIDYDLTLRRHDLATLFTSEYWSDFLQICAHAISMLSFGRIRHLMPMSRWGNILEVFATITGPVLLTLLIIALRRTFRGPRT